MTEGLSRALGQLVGSRLRLEGGRPHVEVASERELLRLMELVAEHRTSLAALDVSLRRLNEVGPVDATSSLVEAAAGCTLSDIEEQLAPVGMSLGPLSPGILQLTLGEFLEGPHAGLRAVRGGRLEPLNLALRALLADGSIYRSHASPRSAAGPRLEALLLGGQGRAGRVLGATLRLFARPTSGRELLLAASEPSSLIRALRLALSDGACLSRVRLWLRAGGALAEVRAVGNPESVVRDLASVEQRSRESGGRTEAASTAPPLTGEREERELTWDALSPPLRAGATLVLHRLSIDTVLADVPKGLVEPVVPDTSSAELCARIVKGVDPGALFGGLP